VGPLTLAEFRLSHDARDILVYLLDGHPGCEVARLARLRTSDIEPERLSTGLPRLRLHLRNLAPALASSR
jgi:hypothetical protein